MQQKSIIMNFEPRLKPGSIYNLYVRLTGICRRNRRAFR